MNIFEDYQKIAQQNGFLFEGMEDNKTFLLTASDRILNSKHCLLSKNEMVYFAYDSYAAKVGMSSTFSGVYTTISNVYFTNFKAEITKRFWFDFIEGKKKIKTKDSFIDKHLAITTNNIEQLLRIIDVRIADNYLETWAKHPPLKIIFETNYLPYIVFFKDKLIVGIESNEWIMPDNFVTTFNDLQELIAEIILKTNKFGNDL